MSSARHDAFLQDPPVVIDVLEEQVERRQALDETALDRFPLARRDDARQQVVGKDPLCALIVSVDREGHALMEERAVGILLPPPQLGWRELEQALVQRVVGRARHAGSLEHFVITLIEQVVSEEACLNAHGAIRGHDSAILRQREGSRTIAHTNVVAAIVKPTKLSGVSVESGLAFANFRGNSRGSTLCWSTVLASAPRVTPPRDSLLWTLDEISHLVSHSGNPAETLENIVQLIQRTFDTDVCSVYLLEADRSTLVLAATIGLRATSVGRVRMRLTEGLAGLVGEQLRPLVVEDATRHPRFKYFSEAGEDPYHSFLGVPLIDRGLLQGVLVVQTIEPRVFSHDAVRMLSTAGAQLASIVSHARTQGQFVLPGHQRLEALARNLWWSWDHDTTSLFHALDPPLWRETDHNPIALLRQMPAALLEERVIRAVAAQPHQLRLPPDAGAPDVDAYLGCASCGRAVGTSCRVFFCGIRPP